MLTVYRDGRWFQTQSETYTKHWEGGVRLANGQKVGNIPCSSFWCLCWKFISKQSWNAGWLMGGLHCPLYVRRMCLCWCFVWNKNMSGDFVIASERFVRAALFISLCYNQKHIVLSGEAVVSLNYWSVVMRIEAILFTIWVTVQWTIYKCM